MRKLILSLLALLLGIAAANAQNTPITPKTECDIVSMPYYEGFEDYTSSDFPSCWANLRGNNYVESGTNASAGTHCLHMQGSTVVATPVFDFGGSDVYLKFNMKREGEHSGTMAIGIAASHNPDDIAAAVYIDTIEADISYNTYRLLFQNNSYLQNGCIVFKQFTNVSYYYYWIDELMVEERPACMYPFDLSASATENSLTLSWTDYDNPSQWLLKVNNGTWQTINSNPYTLTGLEPNTEYTITLATLCNGSDTSESTTGTFHTECIAENLPYTNGFESYTSGQGNFPDCWHSNTEDNYVETGANASSGNNCLHMEDPTVVTSPFLDLGGRDVYLKFNMKRENEYSGTMAIGIAASHTSDDIAAAVYIDTIGADTSYNTYRLLFQNNSNLQNGCIVFKQLSDHNNYYYWIDELIVSEVPTCLPPFNLSATVSDYSLNLSWTAYGNATQWVLKVNDNAWQTINSNPYLLTGLEPNTEYTITLATLCNGSDTSESITRTYHTECIAENLPYTNGFESYTSGEGNFPDCWYSSNLENDYTYVESGANASIGNNCLHMQGHTVVASPFLDFGGSDVYLKFNMKREDARSGTMAIGIAASHNPDDIAAAVYIDTIEADNSYNTYRLVFQNNSNLQNGCVVFKQFPDYVNWFYWIDELLVEERPECMPPFNFSATATDNSLNLSWRDYSDATQWVLKVDDGAWQTINSNPYTLTGLEPNTEYTITLSELCNGVDTSESTTGTFLTECNAENLPYSENFEGNIACWRQEQINNEEVSWELYNTHYSYTAHEGEQFIELEGNVAAQTRLISPIINCEGFTNVNVRFAHIQKGAYHQDSLKIEYRLNCNDEWHVVASYTNDIQEWTVDTIVLPESSPTLQIAFHGYMEGAWGIGIDDVKIFINEHVSIACVSVGQNGHNVVKWEPMQNSTPTGYNIYREGLGGYTQVDFVEYTGATEYSWEDETSNTATQAYSYKISETYSNGTESDISLPHTTMHLQISQGQGSTWNLSWTPYIGFSYDGYRIYRGTSAENMEFLTELSSAATTFSDNNAPSGNIYYQVEVVASSGSGAKAIAIVSRSNIATSVMNPTYTITVVSNNPTMGTVSGGGTYDAGASATISASGNSGYHFAHWNDGITDSVRTVTVTADASYTAYFEANGGGETQQYLITVTSINETMGTVAGGGLFDAGTVTTIMAAPNAGYSFVQWQDGNTDDIRTITVVADATYTAFFRAITEGIDDVEAADDMKVYTRGKTIVIETETEAIKHSGNQAITVYDVMGRVIRTEAIKHSDNQTIIPVTSAGVYMVKVGEHPSRKVLVRP